MTESNTNSPAASDARSGADSPSPLTLTVHSLPEGRLADGQSPGAMPTAQDAAAMRRGRMKMLLVTFVCAAPVIASYLAFYFVRPDARRNYGVLVAQSAIPATLSVRTQASVTQPFLGLKDQWLLVSVASADCAATCEKHLYLQRQLRESLGREKERLDWVWLVTDQAPLPSRLMPALQEAQILRVDRAALAQWLQPADGSRLEDHLYVVDPMGNWMMRFPADIDAGKAKKDLERLLRASVHWDKPGRNVQKAAKP
jgi:hypothetical protein